MKTNKQRGLLDWLVQESQQSHGLPREASERRARVAPALPQSSLPARLQDQGEIGRGGMSSVRRVLDVNLQRHVAMKVLDPRLAFDAREVQRFREEAQITGQLDHQNVPPVYELGQDEEGTSYFTMKLVEGLTLSDWLRETRFSPSDEAALFRVLEVYVKVCQAVAFAHERGVLHLDIKPTNVMIGTHGQVYLMDWGISRLVDGERPSGAGKGAPRVRVTPRSTKDADEGRVSGTIAYMAPEQAKGLVEQLDERTDVFSLGALLYRILSGQPPYLADAVEDLLRLAEQAAIPYPQTLRPELAMPQRLCDIAMQALAADPDDRYATVDALVSEVQAFLHGDGRFHQEQFEAGALVIREGDSGDAAYVVGEGRCVAFKMVDGVRRNLREMGPGDVFGETAILTEGRRTASVEALEPLVVTVVTRQSLEQEIGQCHWMGRVVRSLAERFRDVDERHTLVRTMLDESKLTLEIMRYLALNATGTKKRRAAPWTPLATALTRRFGRPRAELAEHVRRTGLVEIDLAQDEIVLVDTRA